MRPALRIFAGLGLLLVVAGAAAYAGWLYGLEMMAEITAAQHVDRAMDDAAATLRAIERVDSTSAKEVLDDRLRSAAVGIGQHVFLDNAWTCDEGERQTVMKLRSYLAANPSPPGDFRESMYLPLHDQDSFARAIKICD